MNPKESFGIEVLTPSRASLEEEKARDIAGGGLFEDIIEELSSKKLLEGCVERTREEFGARVEAAHFTPTPKDWEMLTAMRLFHPDTAEHCARTLKILSHKINETLTRPDGTAVNLGENIIAEDVRIEEFLRAALLHDVGKIIIPRSVLGNPMPNAKWWEALKSAVNSSEGEAESIRARISELSGVPFDIDGYKDDLEARGVRPIQVCPVRFVLSDDELAALVKRGFSPENTLSEIIMAHEEESFRILENAGFPVEAKLAGMHHNYSRKSAGKQSLSIEALQVGADTVGISMADVIHLADVTDALLSARSYKGSMPPLKVLAILVQHAKEGKISKEMTYMWVKNELAKNEISENDKITSADDFNAIGLFLHDEETEARERVARRAA